MRWLLVLVLLLTSGCGGGYVAPQAAIRIEFASTSDFDTAFAAVKAHMLTQGFEQLPEEPTPAFMLDNSNAGMRWRLQHSKHFWRDRGGLFDAEQARVDITPYPDRSADYQVYNGYSDAQPHWPFLEIHISEARPDGFSPGTLTFYNDLVNWLSASNMTVIDLASPRAGDAGAYAAYVTSGLVQTAAWWLGIWVVCMSIIGGLAMWGLRRLGLRAPLRRVALVMIGTLLVTPTPAPTVLITLMLPNVLLIWWPTQYPLLIQHFGIFMAITFAVSLVLSAVCAFLFVRDHRAISSAEA